MQITFNHEITICPDERYYFFDLELTGDFGGDEFELMSIKVVGFMEFKGHEKLSDMKEYMATVYLCEHYLETFNDEIWEELNKQKDDILGYAIEAYKEQEEV